MSRTSRCCRPGQGPALAAGTCCQHHPRHRHGRIETWTLKIAHVSGLDFPAPPGHQDHPLAEGHRRRQDLRETAYAVTSLTSADASAQDLARLVREHWSIEAHHHVRDVTFDEDTATSRTSGGPANLATIRAAITAALKDAGYLHIPEGRRAAPVRRRNSTPPRPRSGQMQHSRNTPEPAGRSGSA